MKKMILLFIFIAFVVSCKNNSTNDKEQNETEVSNVSDAMNEIESEISEVTQRVDNNFNRLKETRNQINEAEETMAGLTKGFAEYINANNDLILAKKAQQEVLDRINNKYNEYLGYDLSEYSNDEVIYSARDLIKAAIREKMLIEYRDNLYY